MTPHLERQLAVLFSALGIALCALAGAPKSARAEEPPATFLRGLNLNGPALTIDGHDWEGQESKCYRCRGNAFDNQSVPLRPATDRNRAKMIRSSRWGGDIDVELLEIPSGTCQVFLYVWEDNDPEQYRILLNDQTVVTSYNSGRAGHWERLGPWKLAVEGGSIRISARGGAANLSGIEVWSGSGVVPPIGNSGADEFVSAPTTEQIQFFERKIRPLLVQNCYECHSATSKKVGGSLLLDSRAGIIKGGDSEPPIVPGNPEESLLMAAVRYEAPGLNMPPKKRLSPEEIADFERWIRMGAPDPRTEETAAAPSKYTIDWEKAREFWSFQTIADPPVPAVRDASWPANDIDRFILSRLEAAALSPAPDADPRTLVRRVTYDLTGLPPTPEEVEAFAAAPSRDAYERLVDRLLASPAYGERWGRAWLDVARYADTAGDNSDFPIPQMYRYRNWVIEAMNRDLPFDQFVREQLAGDLIPGGTEAERRERLIATGYIANARRFGSRVDDYPQHLTIEDTLDNLGRAFLGLSVNCARCHDHKFDPLTAQDYYALYGIFHSTRYPWPGIELEQKQRDLVPLVPTKDVESVLAARRERQAMLDAEVRRLEKERDAAKEGTDARKKLDEAVDAARKIAETFSKEPLPFEQAYAVAESGKIEDVRVQLKGDPARSGPIVHRRFLTILGGRELPVDNSSSGRLQLADWIVDPGNPLTPRVIVNRVWQSHFGKGIVPTPNDFGKQGRPPTHPELLDWLARRMIACGWSMKSMHRLIVHSRTYRQSSHLDTKSREVDPGNDLLAAFPRHRLDAESIRDTLLALGGNLDSTPGGAHPFPPQTEWKFTQHYPFKAVYDTNRRSVYLMTQRIQRHPYLAIFDGADPSASTPKRLTSTTPLQALYLLNDPFVHEQAARFTARVMHEATADEERIVRAYQLSLSRPPESDEALKGREFLAAARTALREAGVAEGELESQAWQAFVRTLFRLNEFVYID